MDFDPSALPGNDPVAQMIVAGILTRADRSDYLAAFALGLADARAFDEDLHRSDYPSVWGQAGYADGLLGAEPGGITDPTLTENYALLLTETVPALANRIVYPVIAVFSSDYSGRSASLKLTATDNAGTVRDLGLSAWTEKTSGSGLADTGTFQAMGQFDPAWACPVVVDVTIAGIPSVIATQIVRAVDLATITANGLLRVNTPPTITIVTDILPGLPPIISEMT